MLGFVRYSILRCGDYLEVHTCIYCPLLPPKLHQHMDHSKTPPACQTPSSHQTWTPCLHTRRNTHLWIFPLRKTGVTMLLFYGVQIYSIEKDSSSAQNNQIEARTVTISNSTVKFYNKCFTWDENETYTVSAFLLGRYGRLLQRQGEKLNLPSNGLLSLISVGILHHCPKSTAFFLRH